MLELFCNAVGYSIGGTGFAFSFAMYLRMQGPDQYGVPPERLAGRSHPVSWPRLLADRARRVARDDYYGFYDDPFLNPVQAAIDHILMEASPRDFRDHEVVPTRHRFLSCTC